jgi:hypothetical protein
MYPDRDRYTFGEEPSYYAPSFSWAPVKGQINSSDPFAMGILVVIQCATMDSEPHNNHPKQLFLDDVFGISLKSPMFQLKVTGKLRPFRLYKKDVWKAVIPISASVREHNAPATRTVELDAWLDSSIPDSHRSRFENEVFYLVHWRHGPDADDSDMDEATLDCMMLKRRDPT